MQFINNMYQNAQDYYKEIPANTGKQMIYNAGFGFIVETVFTGSPARGAASAAVTALATAIYALVTPTFKYLSSTTYLDWGGEMCRTMTAIIATGCITAATTGNRVILDKIGTLAIIWGFLTLLDSDRGNLNMTNFIALFPSVSIPLDV